jgi:peptidyl-prolyl cis-trans isomerase D
VKADESELKAKYEEMKDLFRTNQPSRDIKFIDVPVQASKADRDEIIAELQEVATQMQAENADFANIIRKSGSIISYSALPVRRAALASDIAKEIDSMAVGTQKGPYLNIADNTQNIVRLIAKTTLPDSVQIRQIGIGGMDEAANKKTADSIMTALNAGVPFDSIAKKYNQTGEAQWITSSQYERATLDDNNLKFINTINAQAVIQISRLRLCNAAWKETVDCWRQILSAINDIDPSVPSWCCPRCVQMGACPERKCCNFIHTDGYEEWRTRYLSNFKHVYTKE